MQFSVRVFVAVLACALVVFFLVHRLPSHENYVVTDPKETAVQLRARALTWLLSFTKENGLFEYELEPQTGKFSTKNNELRQLMSSRLLAQYAQKNTAYLALHKKNLSFILEHWYQEDDGIGYILYQDKSKLGGSAMLLRTLLASPLYEEHAEKAHALARGILATRRGAGFAAWYREPDYAYDEDYLLTFYSGEALLALMEYYEKTGNKEVLEQTVLLADHYIDRYVTHIDESYYPAYVPWHTLAYERLYTATHDQKYADAIFTMNDRLLTMQDTKDYVGRFYNAETPAYGTPHSSSDAVYTEGLVHALHVAQSTGDTVRAGLYNTAIVRSLGNIYTLQYKVIDRNFKAAPEKYLGAIQENAATSTVRIDCAQHLIDALDSYLLTFAN
jgi:hypothetical protein